MLGSFGMLDSMFTHCQLRTAGLAHSMSWHATSECFAHAALDGAVWFDQETLQIDLIDYAYI